MEWAFAVTCCWVLVLLETPFKIPGLLPSDPSDHLMTLSLTSRLAYIQVSPTIQKETSNPTR